MDAPLTAAYLRWTFIRAALARGWWLTAAVYLVAVADLTAAQLVLIGVFQGVTVVIAEVPAGVLADTISRRLALVVGHVVMGTGMTLTGLVTGYPLLVLGQCLWGLGWAISSGADVAWITDELGPAGDADRVLAAQGRYDLLGHPAGIGCFGSLAWATTLSTAIVVAGMGMAALGIVVVARWPESGRPRACGSGRWTAAVLTFRGGLATARADRLIGLVLAATLLVNGGAEGFGRLFERHLFELGVPTSPDPIVWFAAIGIVAASLGSIALRWFEARVDGRGMAAGAYVAASGLAAVGLALFAHAPNTESAVAAAVLVKGAGFPVIRVAATILVNRRTSSETRATVHSLLSQAENLGEIVFGLLLAAVAATWSSTTTLLGSALLVVMAGIAVSRAVPRRPGRSDPRFLVPAEAPPPTIIGGSGVTARSERAGGATMTDARIGGSETLDGRGLLALSRTVTGTLDLQEVLDESFVALRRMISFDGGAIQLVEDGFLRAAATDPPAPPEAYTVRIPVGAGVSGAIAKTGEPIYIPDITVDERVHPEGRKKGLSGGVRSYFGAPLIEHGIPVGVVQIDSTSIDAFGLVERELVLSFLPTISAAVQNARVFEAEQRAHEHVRELERLQRDFLAMVSHELHTPLAKIVGFGDVLAAGAVDDPAEVKQFGAKIGTAGKHLARLIGDVLDVAGIGTVASPADPTPSALPPIVQAAIGSVPESQAHRVTVSIDPTVGELQVDPNLLARVLGLLLDNALKFSDDPVEVVATRPHPTTVEIAVRDTGEGIAEDLLERVFDRFFQADLSSTRRHGGMGVGLFLARTFCERMGHDIRLESTPGAGTVATVTVDAPGVAGDSSPSGSFRGPSVPR